MPGRSRVSSRLRIYPFLLASAPVLSAFATYSVAPAVVLRPLFLALIVTAVAMVVFSVVLRSPVRGAIVTALLVVLVISKVPLALALSLSTTLGIVLYVLRDPAGDRIAAAVDRAAGLLAVVLIVVIAVEWALGGGIGLAGRDLIPESNPTIAHASTGSSAADPDIYVVLLDGYPRADWLGRLFDYSNQPFLEALTRMGFEVSHDSRSNYDSTALTLASMFNMAYLDDQSRLDGIRAGGMPIQPTMRVVINDNRAFELLHDRGYEVIGVGAGWVELSLSRADRFIDSGDLNEFEITMLETTSIGASVSTIAPDLLGNQIRQRIEFNLGQLGGLSAESASRPRFVFIHVPAPHYPIVYDADGGPVRVDTESLYSFGPPGTSQDQLVQAYRGQIEHVNKLVLRALAAMPPPGGRERVVMLMSDHGSLTDLGGDEERLSSFLAVQAPSHPGLMADDPSPVKYLASIFNAYFDTDLPVPPSSGYRTTTPQRLEFRQVYGPAK